MVQEIRRIIFSSDELFSAFEAYARRTPDFLPAGKLRSCAPVDRGGNEVKVKVETSPSGSGKEVELILRGAEVLQPLILFCLENNIMLPRDGRKVFSIVDSRANLTVELNLEFDLVFEEAPMTTEHFSQIKSGPQTVGNA